MKFSILVPVYNVEKYLEQCVESLLNQTYKGEYEIILVDDGSTDSSGKICDEYAESHPQKVKVMHKENGGHTSARLTAIKAATGEYSLFCDSDDFVEKNLLETVSLALGNSQDTDMVMFSFSYYENGNKKTRKTSVFDEIEIFEGNGKKKLYELLISTPTINSLWTKAIRTDILKNDSTDYTILKDKDIAEDAFMVTYYVTACNKITSINKPLYNYRTNQSSISRSYNPLKITQKNTLYLYDRFMECLPKWDMDTAEYRQKLNARWLNEVMFTFSQYYEAASSAKDKKTILNYDWCSMLPAECLRSTSPFENQVYRKLFESLCKKEFLKIRLYFAKRRVYGICKKAKARIKTIWVKPTK